MSHSYQVTTVAGNGERGFKDCKALHSILSYPAGICISDDERIFFSDYSNQVIRMLWNGEVSTIAGNGKLGHQDGNALEAMFSGPWGMCISKDGRIYVTDTISHRIRMIYNDQVTTIAGNGIEGFNDGDAQSTAMFRNPCAICISKDEKLFVCDHYNYRIRMIHNNQVITVAGNGQQGYQDGKALEAMFKGPSAICISKDGRLYVNDQLGHRIRMIHHNKVTTIAGNGFGGFKDGNTLEAMFCNPMGICISNDDRLYISDQVNQRIRMIDDGKVSTIAGNSKHGFQDGNAQDAIFNNPAAICISQDGTLYVSDHSNHMIRMITDTHLKKSPFGFALLLDMRDNILCDSQISFNDITYHLHSTLVNVRCPLLFEKSYYSLILQSNISNKSFESFLTFLYSNKLTKEHNEIWPTNMTIKNIVELIFVFDVMMNCKWILEELNRRFRKQLIEILNKNEQECVKELIVDVLPYVYKLQEIAKTKPSKTTPENLSYTEYCYNILIHALQKRRSIVSQHLTELLKEKIIEGSISERLMSEPTEIQAFDHRIMITFGVELTELSKLAFAKTIISRVDQTPVSSSISTQHLDKWTTPDFVIKLPNDDISYHVHKLILCGRWKYFCQMIESGLKEAIENEMTLSDDWNKSRFEKMMKYIYLNEIEFDEIEDDEWLMENRKLYGITLAKS